MRMMFIFCLLLFAVVGAAQGASSSNNHKGTVDDNGVKDRYDWTLAPAHAPLHENSLISSQRPCA
jgi:hypothetical protein